MNHKQVIVVRTKYPDGKGGTTGLRTGKMIAQGSHASMARISNKIRENLVGNKATVELTDAEIAWYTGNFAKIAVKVETEEQLIAIYDQAVKAGLPVEIITDSGLTEFRGVPTKTCLAIGPESCEKIDVITGNLTLL